MMQFKIIRVHTMLHSDLMKSGTPKNQSFDPSSQALIAQLYRR